MSQTTITINGNTITIDETLVPSIIAALATNQTAPKAKSAPKQKTAPKAKKQTKKQPKAEEKKEDPRATWALDYAKKHSFVTKVEVCELMVKFWCEGGHARDMDAIGAEWSKKGFYWAPINEMEAVRKSEKLKDKRMRKDADLAITSQMNESGKKAWYATPVKMRDYAKYGYKFAA